MHSKFAAVAFVVFVFGGSTALPQGQLIFNNRVGNVVVSPIYGVEPAHPSFARHGNAPDGSPAGPQVYTSPRLSGIGFTAQLFGGTTRAVVQNLQPLFPTASFRSNDAAGYVAPPDFAVTVPNVPEAASAKVVLRVWDNQGGSISNWHQVIADPTIPRGESLPFITPPLGGFSQAPPNLVGLESFNLVTGAVDNLSFKFNFQPRNAMVPAGYRADDGEVFNSHGSGFAYGWNLTQSSQARDRDATNSPDQRFDTLIEMPPGNATTWEADAAPGIYGVHITAGDPQSLAGVYRISAEGVLIVHGTPAPGRHWIGGDGIVEVTDGRLTIANAPGSFSNRICFVEITHLAPPRLQNLPFSPGVFPLRFSAEQGVLYEAQVSSNLVNWSALGIPISARDNLFEFDIVPVTEPAHRFFRTRTLTSPRVAAVVYTNAFEITPGPEWSSTTTTLAPIATRFLGRFGAVTVRLSLTNLPPHTRATVGFDLFVIGSWEGNSMANGVDRWDLGVGGGSTLLTTTFRNTASQTQAYPGNASNGSFPPRTGASENNTLGYGTDAVYRLSYTFLHSSPTLNLDFIGGTTESIANESWGLDNVSVGVLADPYY